jgi:lysophospholipase L1-like esterase
MKMTIALMSVLGLCLGLQLTAKAQQNSVEELMKQDWANLKGFQDANSKVLPPAPGENRVVFMGNSITIGWLRTDPDFFNGKPYLDRGISGQTTPQMLIRFRPDVINLHPKVVVILAGTNDIAGNTGFESVETIFGNIVSMAELAKANGIRVVLSSVLPTADYPWRKGLNPAPRIAQLNGLLKDYAQVHHCVYLDYFSAMLGDSTGAMKPELSGDGVHPNKAGYQVMEPLCELAIKEALKMKLKD